MASPAASGDSPNAPREQEPLEQHHPEPACREAQKWIEAVTGKSFGDKDFRSALENGILLCELLSAIKPGLVKKINRLPTPIAGLDNLSVFLRGCEELGLKGAQLFDPGDLQDTSIRANLKDSDCNRKLKNVLNTVYWLGKAASGCASYSGPTLNLKEFEGLLAQMKLESEEGGDSSQKHGVRDSGYDCWDSERSESLSPPRHTRDNSLDSLDSFGSRSQHSPSPDVVNRGNSDGRGSDSEADAPNRKPDVRKDDMLARRTSSKEARSSVPFNQFLPNRTNATSYVPTPRRKPHTEEREQRSQPQATADQCKKITLLHKTSKTVTWAPENNGGKQEEEVVTQEVLEQRRMQKLEKAGIKVLPAVVRYSSPPEMEEKEPRSPSPNIILRRDNDFLSSQKSAWDSPSDGEEEAAVRKVPDVRRDDLASRRAHRGTIAPKVHQFIPPPLCTDKDRERWEGIRRASQQMLQEKEIRSVSMGDMLNDEEVGHLPSLSQSRHEHMHEQYNNFLEDEDHWQVDLARWKNRRRSASQDLIRKEEERKRIEKRMKGEGRDGNKRKSIKTYKEIVEEKERREAELCEAYRNAATPEVAALVLQRYALRFTISDAVLDSLKLPRSTSTPKTELNELDKEQKPESPVNNSEMSEPLRQPESPVNNAEMSEPLRQPESPVNNAEMSEPLRQPESPVNNAEMSEPLRQPESHVVTNQEHMKPEEIETNTADQQEKSATSPLTPNSPTSPLSTVTDSQSVSPQSLEFNEPQTQLMESPTAQQAAITGDPQPHAQSPTAQQAAITEDPQPQTKHTSPQSVQGQPHPTQPANALPSPPSVSSRPIPLLAAKPYCQPGAALPGHKPIKDGLVRVNGEATEELTVSTPPTSPQHSPQETKDVSSEEAEKDAPSVEAVKSAETAEQQPSETEKSTPSSGSAISSLIEGRNCIITTTIVTELTQKVVEPLHTDTQNDEEVETTGLFEKPEDEKNTQPSSTPSSMEEYSPTVSEGLEESSVTIETPMLNLAKRVNHWVWDPNEERKRLERWQQEQERLLKEQYQREQEKLMKEWEKAQLEVEEEERKHNEEERRILEETVTPLNPTGLLNQVSGQTAATSPGPENDNTTGKNVPLQHNGQKTSTGNEDQHASKLHFFQDSGADVEPSKKQELWKTASLDRNTQLNQGQVVKRSGSHDVVTSQQQSSSPKPQPPSPSRCVSGKRLCTGCSQPLGKGAAMIIDTLGLFFHIHCFKCGLCGVQLGDASAGTDVRIRKGMLSCHECYIASRGRGQPTTL
ncbi:LIM and calponin homology domains-containing protein 1-like isoform X1 [Oreochromis aureus]|uniref:LIM and calponin homology domains-containing protein 1-like isoform X1 n=1 Tax=Oreochromis aureus TaxID=47969 RepID=UPI0019545C5C|nr:LIM and calponin homology domains-containing protein 1-like isoform X1 [Oreochromis aureus]